MRLQGEENRREEKEEEETGGEGDKGMREGAKTFQYFHYENFREFFLGGSLEGLPPTFINITHQLKFPFSIFVSFSNAWLGKDCGVHVKILPRYIELESLDSYLSMRLFFPLFYF